MKTPIENRLALANSCKNCSLKEYLLNYLFFKETSFYYLTYKNFFYF